MKEIYKVNLVPQDLQIEETFFYVAEIMDYLNFVVTDMFEVINKRVEQNKNRIESFNKRIETAQQKVDSLVGTKRATVVYSCTKYPASEVLQNYKPLFSDSDSVPHKPQVMNITKSNVKSHNQVLSEKLKFYHIKTAEVSKNVQIPTEGLGEMSPNINSITDILLFNSSKNPYQNYIQLDPLKLTQHSTESTATADVTLEAAPASISSRDALQRSETINYFYSPGMGNIPSIDVPTDLPDLPGIADDLRYNLEGDVAIAPSMITTPSIPELPVLVNIVHNDSPTQPHKVIEDKKIEPPVSVPSPPAVPPPPPPLPPPAPPMPVEIAPPSVPLIANEQLKQSQSSVLSETKTKEIKDSTVNVSIEVPQSNMRASLMEEIRKAGGMKKAKLRTSNATVEKSIMAAKSTSSPKSFMDDLHTKLSMRRKGISGSKNNPSKDTNNPDMGNAMTRISAMIPPPPRPEQNETATTDDGEWD